METTRYSVTIVVEYEYDAEGNRVRKVLDGTIVTNYLVDSNRDYAQVLEERDQDGTLLVRYVYGHDLISQKRGGVASYYHYDGLGSTRALTSSAEAITDTYTYDAFGKLIDHTGSTPNDYLFTGEQFDPELGFYYLRARYMDPSIGRFVTMDTFSGFSQDPYSLHKYLYANANPITYSDPSGYVTLNEVAMTTLIVGVLVGIRGSTLITTESEPIHGTDPNEVTPTKLVKIAIAVMGRGDENTFIGRATHVKSDKLLQPSTGQEFLLLLSKHSSKTELIRELFVFSHAYPRGIIMSPDQGFYVELGLWERVQVFFGFRDSRDIDDLINMIKKGEIAFSKDTVIKLFGCNLATGEFAQRLAEATGGTVIAAKGKVSPATKKIGKRVVETGWMVADEAWYEHRPHQKPKKIGKRIKAW